MSAKPEESIHRQVEEKDDEEQATDSSPVGEGVTTLNINIHKGIRTEPFSQQGAMLGKKETERRGNKQILYQKKSPIHIVYYEYQQRSLQR